MAVGLALAQAVSVERVKQVEVEKVEYRETDTRDAGADQDNRGRDTGIRDYSQEVDQGAVKNGEKLDLSADSKGQDTGAEQVVQEVVETVELVEQVAQVVEQITEDLSGAEEVQTAVVTQSIDLSDQEVVQEVESEAATVVQVVDTTQKATTEEVQISDLNAGQQDLHINHKQKKKKDSEEEVVVEESLAGVNEAVQRDFDETSKIKKIDHNRRKEQDSPHEVHNAQNQEQTQSAADAASRRNAQNEAFNQRKQSQDFAAGLQNQKHGEGGHKSAASREDNDQDLMPETAAGPVQRSSERSTEGSIQMTILRQSFESLRVKGADMADGRAKSQTPTVNAAGAASEPKSTQAEQGSRASKNLTRSQTAKMLERVESTLKEAARSRDGRTISLHLEPVNLGKVKVDVSLRDGTLHARIAPENQQVVQALREHAHELQSSLRKLGLDVDSVSVAVTTDSFSGEMASGDQMMNGRSFQEERNNLPDRRAQVLENTLGNELADWSKAGATTQGSATGKVLDHWVA
jgi:flagellar hook-length control protein FliK